MSDLNALARAIISPDRLYVFAVNMLHPGFKSEIVTTYLKDARTVSEWAYYIPGVYLIRSNADALFLGESLRQVVGGAYCLLLEADANNSNGWLPRDAWEWINRSRRPASGLVPSGFGPLLRQDSED
jgi:hypothetical protein